MSITFNLREVETIVSLQEYGFVILFDYDDEYLDEEDEDYSDIDIQTSLLRGRICNYFDDKRNNYIFLDRVGLFDKLNRCPIQLRLPKTDEERQFLYNSIQWLSTIEGYKASKEYDESKWITKYE